MPKLDVSKSTKEHKQFYDNEILTDFQVRQKGVSKGKESLQTGIPNDVGMQTITPKSNFGKYFVEFASGSTIHGLNHLVAPNRHPVEKILAVLLIGGALLCLIFLSLIFWARYQDHATVIMVDNDHDLFKIPKPALFICPISNIQEDKIPSVLKKYGIDHTPEAEQFFTFLANVNYENMLNTPLFDKVPSSNWSEILYDLRKNVSSNLLKENKRYNAWVMTERGVCLAVRSVLAVYMTLEYWKGDTSKVIPLHHATFDQYDLPYYDHSDEGIEDSVSIEDSALFGMCDPFEIITYDTPMKLIRAKVLQRTILSASLIKTDSVVKKLHVHQRKCKYLTDGGLDMWPVYTRNMCVFECRMKVIEKRCKCRPHFAKPDGGVSICNAAQLRCIGGIIKDLFLFEYPPPFCGCVPKCNVASYKMRDTERSELSDTPINLSILTLIIEIPQTVYHRLLFYGFSDFLASVGGAAGLFLGASVLSFIEILYYVTLRAYFYMKQTNKRNKKQSEIVANLL